MPGLDDIDNLSLDQMEQLARGETAGLLPEVSPVSQPEPEPKPDVKTEPAPSAKVEDKKSAPAADDADDDEPPPADPNTAQVPYQKWARDKKKLTSLVKQLEAKTAEERVAASREITELREKFARGDERLRLLSEVMQPAQAEPEDPDPKPDPSVDIVAYMAWQDRELGRLRESQQKTDQSFADVRTEQQLREAYQADAIAFAGEKKDWGAAYNHLLGVRWNSLVRQGYQPEQIKVVIQKEERGLVERAIKNRQRPAELIYETAMDYGYRPAAPQPDPALTPAANGNGAANGHANGNGAEQKPSVVEEVERIQRGMAGSKSLADVGGSNQEVSVEALAAMSDKEFAAYYAKHQARHVDTLLGEALDNFLSAPCLWGQSQARPEW
jgi:hypothetical protein